MKSVASYVAIICLIFSIDAIDSALLVLRDGTTFLSKFSSEWTTSPDRMMKPEFLRWTSSYWWPGGVPWRGNQSDAPVTVYIGITVDQLKVLRGAQEITRQRHQLIYVVFCPLGEFIQLYSARCIIIAELENKPTLPMWSPCVCDIATRVISDGFSPIWAS
jgi:hypothetical protein